MGNIRAPEYGVKKDELTLTTQDPNAVMYGVAPDNTFIPIKVSDTGEIMLGGTITLEPGDLQIGAVELKNYNTDDRVFISTDHAVRSDSRIQAYDPSATDWEFVTSTNILGKQGIDVNVIGGGSIGVAEDEDDDIPPNKPSAQLLISLGYAYDPNNARWERVTQKNKRLIIDGSEVTQPISAASLPLPTGAATESTLNGLRTDFNGVDFATETTVAAILAQLDVDLSTRASEATLSTIDSKLNTLGQKLSANSVPVVLASDQSVLSITGNVNISNDPNVRIQDSLGNSINSTSGSLDVNITGGAAGGPSDTEDGSVSGGQVANLNIGLNYGWNGTTWERVASSSGRLKVDGSDVTQPISAASLPLPTGAATESTLSNIDSTLTTQLDVVLSTRASESTLSSLNSKDFATETTLNSLLTAFNSEDFASETTLSSLNSKVTAVDTGNVSVVSSALPTGAATEATLSNLLLDATFIARINTQGQKTMSGSTPVVLPSDQSAIPVTQSGTWDINNISGTISLPTGAATEATLLSLDSKDFATETTLNSLLTAFNAEDFATETTLSSIDSTLTSQLDVLLSTRASEATLAALNAKVTAVDTGDVTIGSALPAGTNNIGDVGIANEPSVNLQDGAGNDLTSTSGDGSSRALDVSPHKATGSVEHFNGNIGTGGTTITFSGDSQSVLIKNNDAVFGGDSLNISFDGGTTFFTLNPQQTLSIEARHASIDIAAATNTVDYQILVVV